MLELQAARDLTRLVLDQRWSLTRQPILGSQFKKDLQDQARADGNEFDEATIGYSSFLEFLKDCDFLHILIRPGTDFLVAPIDEADALDQQLLTDFRIRPDFWRAFVTFPTPQRAVAFDPITKKAVRLPTPDIPETMISINPISREEQLQWRREFIESFPEDSPTRMIDLDVESGFTNFARVLETNDGLRRAWNTQLLRKVYGAIKSWAEANDIQPPIWLVHRSPSSEVDEIRKQLYRILDGISVDNLVQISVPLSWLIKNKNKD